MTSQRNHEQPIRIAVVGDYDQWEADDGIAFRSWVLIWCCLSDFGNESVEVVRMIAALTSQSSGFGKPRCLVHRLDGVAKSPHDHDKEDWVQEQLNLLPMWLWQLDSRR